MKKFLFIFNKQTLLVVILSYLSSFLSLRFQISMYIDFLFVGVFIAFPLTFTLREAFKRRERALQYLSLFKGSLQSVFYSFEKSKLEADKKLEFENIAVNTSDVLIRYLSSKAGDAAEVQKASRSIAEFIHINRKELKGSFAVKILLFLFRVNTSIEFLLATKRHRTPWGVRAVVLFVVYGFIIFYPASLLNDKGFDVALWYVFVMTVFKGLLLISLCNVQMLLEDPFNPDGFDSIRLNDFQFTGSIPGSFEITPATKKKDKEDAASEERKEEKDSEEDDD